MTPPSPGSKEGPVHHLQLRRGDVGRYVLLPGDPGRCRPIAERFDSAYFVAANREYVTWTGSLLGETVSVTSTGIGCPSTAIAVEELIQCGADTFIRVGTSGGMQPNVRTGDLAIALGAIRDEGTSRQYLPIEFPALAHPEVVIALREAAVRCGQQVHIGVFHSKDSFYGEIEPRRMPIATDLLDRWQAWIGGGAVCSEMEAAAIFTVGSIRRVRTGAVVVTVGNPTMTREQVEASLSGFTLDGLLDTAVEALRILIERDRERSGHDH
jgi:uridine phosphorylase